MRIRVSLKHKILSLIEEKGYVILRTSEEAISLINNLFPNTPENIINYLNDNKKYEYIVFRKTAKSFDIGYRAERFSYYTDTSLRIVPIEESKVFDIRSLL